MPGVAPRNAAAQSDTFSQRSVAAGPTDKELGVDVKSLSTCKYESAIQKCPVVAALKDCNMASALQNVKKMATTANRSGLSEWEEKCLEHTSKVNSCVAVTWPTMSSSTLVAVRKNVDIIAAKVQSELNPETYVWFAGTFALEMLKSKPQAATFHGVIEDEFWKCVDLAERPTEKYNYNLDQPSVWSKNVPAHILQMTGPKMLTTIKIEGVYLPLVQKGGSLQTTCAS